MTVKLEVEQKFFCSDTENLTNLIKTLNFKNIGEFNEVDEYFTDINSIFIKNRTCLRIRKTNNKNMELTFKGKSDKLNDLQGKYAKMENNLDIDINSYDTLKNMLFSLGYYSYCIVNKSRIEYSKDENNRKYNILIDNIKNVGSFVEFEILGDDKENKNFLIAELQNFIRQFNKIELKEAILPYRDFVAKYNFDLIKNNYNLEKIYVNYNENDKELFLKQNLLEQLKNKNIKIEEYKNQNIDKYLIVAENFDVRKLFWIINHI